MNFQELPHSITQFKAEKGYKATWNALSPFLPSPVFVGQKPGCHKLLSIATMQCHRIFSAYLFFLLPARLVYALTNFDQCAERVAGLVLNCTSNDIFCPS